jgi:hypothetical protein
MSNIEVLWEGYVPFKKSLKSSANKSHQINNKKSLPGSFVEEHAYHNSGESTEYGQFGNKKEEMVRRKCHLNGIKTRFKLDWPTFT